MNHAKLSVAISIPKKGPNDRLSNYYHWTLHTYDRATDNHVQYEVEGEANHLSRNELYTDPSISAALIKEIDIGSMYTKDLPLLRDTIHQVEIQNDIYSWDCQDYVIEILDALEDVGLLGSDEKYGLIKAKIKRMRGTMDQSRRLIQHYDPDNLDMSDEGASSEEVDEGEGPQEEAESKRAFLLSEERIVDSDDDESD